MASTVISSETFCGIRSSFRALWSLTVPSSATVLRLLYLRQRSDIFHSLIVLSEQKKGGGGGGGGGGT